MIIGLPHCPVPDFLFLSSSETTGFQKKHRTIGSQQLRNCGKILGRKFSLYIVTCYWGTKVCFKMKDGETEHPWLPPVFLATQKAEIKRIKVQSHPGQIVCETLSQKTPLQKRAGRVAQGVGPEFKPQY
jgi:hypothetical protein